MDTPFVWKRHPVSIPHVTSAHSRDSVMRPRATTRWVAAALAAICLRTEETTIGSVPRTIVEPSTLGE